jgi:predicted dehydrogenase
VGAAVCLFRHEERWIVALSVQRPAGPAAAAVWFKDLNELEVHYIASRPGERQQGFRRVLVPEADHPFIANWWPPGHIIGWEHTFVHELHHLLTAIAGAGTVTPDGADFEDGYRAAEVCDAVVRSSETGDRVAIVYR